MGSLFKSNIKNALPSSITDGSYLSKMYLHFYKNIYKIEIRLQYLDNILL